MASNQNTVKDMSGGEESVQSTEQQLHTGTAPAVEESVSAPVSSAPAPAPSPAPTGIWIGIDLGTTNSTAAFYSPSKNKAKLIRFRPQFATLQQNGKYGRILPSAVQLTCDDDDDDDDDGEEDGKDGNNNNNNKKIREVSIGAEALKNERNRKQTQNNSSSSVMLSSVKRIWGMDAKQVDNELKQDTSFLEGCPFDTIITDTDNETDTDNDTEDKEVMIIIPSSSDNEDGDAKNDNVATVSPMYVAEVLLRTIKEEATHYFQKEKEVAVGMTSKNTDADADADANVVNVNNCILTVPAHFSRNRRDQMVKVAKSKAVGFDGHVGTMVESTAAAMAYGLFVGSTKPRKILVFDMGGGTTDVTIAEMLPPSSSSPPEGSGFESGSNSGSNDKDQPLFKVLGTMGERRLGGDDMDASLIEYVKDELVRKEEKAFTSFSKLELNQLRLSCRVAKEDLCGDGKDKDPAKSSKVEIVRSSTSSSASASSYVTITQDTFGHAMAPLVARAAVLVEDALQSCNCTADDIDEVILVGGATRTPAVRTMLQTKFPKNELCYSIDPYAAVAQGAAIQGAIVSNLVPRHELRNALMLDALPHPIGVLVKEGTGKDKDDEMYLPILESGMELPAMHFASFRLADVKQKGITIVAVEDVGDDLPLERLGEFTFLLHRLKSFTGKERMIDVGMTVETSGKFIVSIFDKNDPDHLKKKIRYQERKRKQQHQDGSDTSTRTVVSKPKNLYALEDVLEKESFGREEIMLVIGVAIVFILYVGIKMCFQEIEEGSHIL
mmetsp:Transcript_21512/g.32692  ORF Transcript_21512/g.32692 Transcript_21512/m.32692 type:complete len:779 (+) Transcript_21512:66-2402(+)